MPIQPRRAVLDHTPVVHGGPDRAELERLGVCPEELLDFSVSTNPLGPSPAALAAVREADAGRYPDRATLSLRRKLSEMCGLELDSVLVSNGSVELIWLAAICFLREGDSAFVLEPTFGEYRAAASMMGARVGEWRASPLADFRVDTAAVVESLHTFVPRLAFVCNPNNPTGAWLTRPDLERLLEALADGLLVVDEAYLDLAGEESAAGWLTGSDNLLLLRSMTKDYGLPGLRLGYGLAAPAIIRALAAIQPPWSVNAQAQAAGLAALDDRAHLEAGRRLAREARAYLTARLESLGYGCVLSGAAANFWLVEVGNAARLRQQLLERGILVRDCTSFGLPTYIRLAARPLPECERLVSALAEMKDRASA